MRQFILATALLGIATCALLPTQSPQYLPPNNQYSGSSSGNHYQSSNSNNGFSATVNNQYGTPAVQNQYQSNNQNQYSAGNNQNQYNAGSQSQYQAGAQNQYQGGQIGYQASQSQHNGGAQQYSGPTQPPVPILRLDQQNEGDGNYQYAFETGNGIQAQEHGLAHGDGTKSTGSYSYTSPEGEQIQISYNADENGYQPQGSHIPTSPPIPEEILRALEQNAADEANGISDDGQYRPEHEGPQDYQKSGSYGHHQNNQYQQQSSTNQNQHNQQSSNQYQGNFQSNQSGGNQYQSGSQGNNQYQGSQSNQYIPPSQGNQNVNNGGYKY